MVNIIVYRYNHVYIFFMNGYTLSVCFYYTILVSFTSTNWRQNCSQLETAIFFRQTQVLRRLLWRSSYLHNDWKSMHLCNSAQMRTVANQAQRSQILRSFNNVCLSENWGENPNSNGLWSCSLLKWLFRQTNV